MQNISASCKIDDAEQQQMTIIACHIFRLEAIFAIRVTCCIIVGIL